MSSVTIRVFDRFIWQQCAREVGVRETESQEVHSGGAYTWEWRAKDVLNQEEGSSMKFMVRQKEGKKASSLSD